MKKTLLLALGAMLSINAWSYDNVAATVKWTVGNESAATIESDAADGVKDTKVAVGAGLTVVGTKSNYDANNGNAMVQYQPAESNAGAVATVMIEYSVKMKKGVTFTLTGLSYDAIKDGTDNASYSWSYAVDGVESTITDVSKDDLVRNNNTTGTPALNHAETINATAGQNVSLRIYVSGFANNKKLALSNIVLTGTINGEEEVRTFTDFQIDFRSETPTFVLPEGGVQPGNVSFANLNYKDAQHGIQGGTITVNVDGPVKFTLGGCQYGNNIAVQKNGEDLTTIDNKVGCDNSGVGAGYTKFVTWTYNVEEAAVLTFTVNGYLPYFFAEACDFVPQVEVRYYDVDGKTLIGSETVEGGSALAYAYHASDVTVADGKAFRGWYNGTIPTATKVTEGFALTENLNLYAKTTDIEVAELGKIYDYDFRPNYFYPEDHELLTITGGNSHNGTQHGWAFNSGSTLGIKVAGNALLAIDVCTYTTTGETEIKDADGNIVGSVSVEREVTGDGAKQTVYYEGPATTLTFYFTATNYIHHIKVYNIAALPTKDEATGYYLIAPGDGAGLKLVLESIQEGDKIFLPNGVYDFGEAVNTQISKNNISIIGQSMEGTIIKNAPNFYNEGLGQTATLFIPTSVSGTYMQDLTLQNAMDYYAAIAAGLQGGRACSLQDEGNHTVLKNVRMLSYQDTYYGKTAGSRHYFEDCEIHGTVDYLCGGSTVYFKNNLLYCEKRNANGGGSDCITANGGKDDKGDKGYVFEGCTIKSECPVVSLGRAWSDQARTYFLNTLVDYSAGEFSFSGSGIQRWTQTGINTNPTEYGEYNTHLADGTVLTPASNVVTFNKGSEVQMETVLSAERAAELTMDYTLGEWAATAKTDATQAVCDLENIEDDAVYLVEALNGNAELMLGSKLKGEVFPEGSGITVRKANARGGFGLKAGEEPQGVENTKAAETKKAVKVFRDGQVVILRDGREFNVLGAELK